MLFCLNCFIYIFKNVSDLIEEVLEQIRPENMFYAVISQQYAGKKDNIKEKWYQTEYSSTKIDKVYHLWPVLSFVYQLIFRIEQIIFNV